MLKYLETASGTNLGILDMWSSSIMAEVQLADNGTVTKKSAHTK